MAVPFSPRALASIGVVLALAACGALNDASRGIVSIVSPYQIDVVQGNFVSREQVAALRPGMPRSQVRDILGTPLLTDVFHADRWDYVFTMRRGAGKPVERRLTLHFSGDTLERFEGDEMPEEADFIATLDARRRAKVPLLEAPPEKLEKFAPDAVRKRTPSNGAPVAPGAVDENAPLPASYPPLE